MKSNPLISIIVPVYKAEKYLHRCVDSLLAQTFQDFEILLIDDGSPDQSGEICDEYARQDSRVRVLHKENGGVSSARNKGLDNAIGEYLTFIDADDWLDIDCFEKGFSLLKQNDLDILQYSYRMISEEDESIISVHEYDCNPMNWIDFVKEDHFLECVWGNFIRMSIIERYHLRFDEDLHLAEDQLFIMMAMTLSKKIAQTNKIYYNYFQNPESATHNSRKEDIIKSSEILLNFGKRNCLFKPQIDRLITTFYIDLLLINVDEARDLDALFFGEKIRFSNLSLTSSRLLCAFSFLGMNIAGKIVLIYLYFRKIFADFSDKKVIWFKRIFFCFLWSGYMNCYMR